MWGFSLEGEISLLRELGQYTNLGTTDGRGAAVGAGVPGCSD